MAESSLELREVIVLLGAAGVVVPLFHRLKISPVLGFLLVGVTIGPSGVGRLGAEWPLLQLVSVHDLSLVRIAGEFGVMFLLFMIGLELSTDRLWRLRRWVFGLGLAQVAVTALAIALVAFAFGNGPAASIVLGAALALSSTAVVMQLLTEAGRLGTPGGQTSFSVLLLQDLAVVPILFLVGALSAGSGSLASGVALAIGKAGLAIAIILGAGRFVIRPLLALVAGTGSRELFLAAVLLAVIGTAAATGAAGLSHALGAFLAGLLLSETEFRHRIAVDLEPFKGLLLGIFFLAVGMGIDPAAMLAEPLWLFASVAGMLALKAGIMFGLARLAGLPMAVAAETGLLLAQGGEFAFVVVNLAISGGLMPAATGQFMLLVVGLSMAVTPLLATVAWRLGRDLAPAGVDPGPVTVAPDISGHAVIVGYGRVGRLVGRLLDEQRIPHFAIDQRPDRVAALRAEGVEVFQGDAAQHELLARLSLATAQALVVTMDDPDLARRVVAAARKDWPNIAIYARVHDDRHARELLSAGATHVIPETTEVSLQLGEAVLAGMGVPPVAAEELAARIRAETRAELWRKE